MLGATVLDITGDALRLPFGSFALVFTDRYALGLAERMISRERRSRLRGRMLRTVTAYVTQTATCGETRHVRVSLACDAHDGGEPDVVVRELVVEPKAAVDTMLDTHMPDSVKSPLEPVFTGSPVRRLVHLVLNSILYACSAERELGPPAPRLATERPSAWSVPPTKSTSCRARSTSAAWRISSDCGARAASAT